MSIANDKADRFLDSKQQLEGEVLIAPAVMLDIFKQLQLLIIMSRAEIIKCQFSYTAAPVHIFVDV